MKAEPTGRFLRNLPQS